MKLFWFRVQLGADGKVVSCAQVDECGDAETGAVYFLRAPNLTKAKRSAYNSYHAARLAARRAKYEAEGKCKCGRKRDGESPIDRAFKTCVQCRKLNGPQHARALARAHGLPVPPAPTKAEYFSSRRDEEKLEMLLAVEEQFHRNTMRNFGLWLRAEIAKLQPKAAPKLRVVGS